MTPSASAAIGTSAGGNIVLYGAPDAQPIKAVLGDPADAAGRASTRTFARTELGPLGPALIKPMDLLYRLMRAPLPSRAGPGDPRPRLNGTVVQYVQGTGDQWGEMAVVEEFAAATPHTAGPVIRYPSTERYRGYQYISERADDIVAFFDDTSLVG